MGVRLGKEVTGQPGQRTGATVDDRPVIVAFGDSLTAGFGVPPEESYPAQLQRRLNEAGYPYLVLNAGVSGDTSAGGLRRVEWVLRSHPRIVILEFGGNDGLRGLDIKQTTANIEAMVTRFQQAGVTVVLAGMQLPPNYGRDYTDQFARLYAELAKTHGVTLIPFFLEGVAARPELNQADGIHPTGAGYRKIADNVMKTLRSLLGGESAAQRARKS
jgi:acyl-CoA thioesterase-1